MDMNRRIFMKTALIYGAASSVLIAGSAYAADGTYVDCPPEGKQTANQTSVSPNGDVISLNHDKVEIVTNLSYYKNRRVSGNIDILYNETQIALTKGSDFYISKEGFKFFEKIGHNFFAREVEGIKQVFILSFDNVLFGLRSSVFIPDTSSVYERLYNAAVSNTLAGAANAHSYDQIHFNSQNKHWSDIGVLNYW